MNVQVKLMSQKKVSELTNTIYDMYIRAVWINYCNELIKDKNVSCHTIDYIMFVDDKEQDCFIHLYYDILC